MTRYKTPNVRHNPPHKRQSKIYFLAKHLNIFALNDIEEDGASVSDTVPMCLVLWICGILFTDENDVLTLVEVGIIEPAKTIFHQINTVKSFCYNVISLMYPVTRNTNWKAASWNSIIFLIYDLRDFQEFHQNSDGIV